MKLSLKHSICLALVFCAFAAWYAYPRLQSNPVPEPSNWAQKVRTKGQPTPVPVAWLETPEGKIAHDLVLPDSVPKPVPFDFESAKLKAWLPNSPSVQEQYFDHLCKTEMGDWYFEKVTGVDGIYFPRPHRPKISGEMTSLYGLEMPWIERIMYLSGPNLEPERLVGWFIDPPHSNYEFVEEPRQELAWQKDIVESYVRVYGLVREKLRSNNYYGTKASKDLWHYYRTSSPMTFMGINAPTAKYGYTWRGLSRENDRQYGISGGEIIIYELATGKILAVRRMFLRVHPGGLKRGLAAWEWAGICKGVEESDIGLEFKQFAFDVIAGKKKSSTHPDEIYDMLSQ
jgi:hypothetical protein